LQSNIPETNRLSPLPKAGEQSPFAAPNQAAPTVRLWMLFVSMMVFAGFSLLLALAIRVPSISNGLRDLMGGSGRPLSPTRERSAHLFMLLFCYSSPLLMMIWVSTLRRFIQFQQRRLDRRIRREELEDSEFNMEN
jgi:hypothetical protein